LDLGIATRDDYHDGDFDLIPKAFDLSALTFEGIALAVYVRNTYLLSCAIRSLRL
jgi:hypothetical protein